jgi:hypothetical protein
MTASQLAAAYDAACTAAVAAGDHSSDPKVVWSKEDQAAAIVDTDIIQNRRRTNNDETQENNPLKRLSYDIGAVHWPFDGGQLLRDADVIEANRYPIKGRKRQGGAHRTNTLKMVKAQMAAGDEEED